MTDRIPIPDLRADLIGSVPITTFWEHCRWQWWEAFEYELRNRTFILVAEDAQVVAVYRHSSARPVLLDYRAPANSIIAELAAVRARENGSQGPMSGRRYPLGDHGLGGRTPIEVAYLLRDLPLCVVALHGEYALALTGSGMNLNREIVEAFTLLGYLPPTHFKLPAMPGRGASEGDRYLIAAVERSLEIAATRAASAVDEHRERWA